MTSWVAYVFLHRVLLGTSPCVFRGNIYTGYTCIELVGHVINYANVSDITPQSFSNVTLPMYTLSGSVSSNERFLRASPNALSGSRKKPIAREG